MVMNIQCEPKAGWEGGWAEESWSDWWGGRHNDSVWEKMGRSVVFRGVYKITNTLHSESYIIEAQPVCFLIPSVVQYTPQHYCNASGRNVWKNMTWSGKTKQNFITKENQWSSLNQYWHWQTLDWIFSHFLSNTNPQNFILNSRGVLKASEHSTNVQGSILGLCIKHKNDAQMYNTHSWLWKFHSM